MASAAEQRDELVEKVAHAMCTARYVGVGVAVGKMWDVLTVSEKDEYRRMARSAIETIRNEQ